MPEQSTECALWYMSHGSAYVELCENEAQAVNRAIGMVEYESGAPDGVQFPDGTYWDADDWPELKAERRRRYEQLLREVRSASKTPRPATVEVVSPTGLRARVEWGDSREWMQRG